MAKPTKEKIAQTTLRFIITFWAVFALIGVCLGAMTLLALLGPAQPTEHQKQLFDILKWIVTGGFGAIIGVLGVKAL